MSDRPDSDASLLTMALEAIGRVGPDDMLVVAVGPKDGSSLAMVSRNLTPQGGSKLALRVLEDAGLPVEEIGLWPL